MHPEIIRMIKKETTLETIKEPVDKANYFWTQYPVCLKYFGLGLGDLVAYFGSDDT